MIKRRALRPNLTPMIDVVFLLLLFFLISTQMGKVQVTDWEVAQASQVSSAGEPPLLIEFGSELRMNGRSASIEDILGTIGVDQRIAIRPDASANVQEVMGFIEQLREVGAERIVLVEGER